MAHSETYTTVIRLNSEEAEKKIDNLKKRVEGLRKEQSNWAEGSAQYKKIQKEIDKLNAELKSTENVTKRVNDTLRNMSSAKPKELRETIKQINGLLNSGSLKRGSEEWKSLTAALKRANTELATIRTETKASQTAWQKFTKFLNDSWGGLTMILGSLAGVTMTVRKAVQDYAAMEEEMADVRKYTGMTADQVRDLNEEFKKMDTRTSREELNQLAGVAGRLGITSKSAILEFVDAADKIGVALGDDLGDGAVDKIGKLAMAFGEDEKMGLRGAMLATGSAVNELAQNSSAKAGYLVDFTARVAGFAKQIGLTQAQIMGFGTVMDENLLRDEMAATAFGNMLTKMQTDVAKFAKIAGMDMKEFSDLLQKDANGAILALADSLKKADPQTMMKMLDDMGLDGSRAVGVLSTLADKIDDVRKHQERATAAYADGTSVIEEYSKMNTTVQAGIDKVKKQFKEMVVQLGERLLPVVRYTITGASALAKALYILTGFVYDHWKMILSLASGYAAYTIAVNIATIKEKAYSAVLAARKGIMVTLIALDKAATLALEVLMGRITLATAAQRVWNKVVMAHPYVAAAVAVATLTSAILSFVARTKEATRAQKDLQAAADEARTSTIGERRELDALVSTARNKALSDDTRREAIRKLQEKYPDYLKNLSLEKINSENATTAIDNLTASLLAEAKARVLVRKIQEAEEEKESLDEKFFSGISGFWERLKADWQATVNDIADKAERVSNTISRLVYHADLKGWEDDTWITKHGYAVNTATQLINNYNAAVKDVSDSITAMNNDLKEQVKIQSQLKGATRTPEPTKDPDPTNPTVYKTDAERKKEEDRRKKQEEERKKALRERAAAAKASYEDQLAAEMLAYRMGLTAYTDYVEEKHNLTQNYYNELKRIYGEDSVEYRRMLDNRERDETEYFAWQTKQKEKNLTIERQKAELTVRRQYYDENNREAYMNEEVLNENLFQISINYMKKRQSFYKKDTKEWLEIQMQIEQEEKQHQFDLEKNWLERLSRYREEMGTTDYDRLQEIELAGVQSFYGALLDQGEMTREEFDAIIDHIKRKYADLRAQQTANTDIQAKAASSLDTARKAAGVKDYGAGDNAASGIFSIATAVKNQQTINEQLKLLYGQDYENNREYQEAKRQLDMETMQSIVAGAQAAYQTIGQFMSAASSYAQACSDLEVARITANYDKQISAAGNNSKKRERLEKERDKKIAEAKTKANKKAMVMEMAQALAQTAMGAISAYSSTMAGAPYPANLILAPMSAGIALAAGALQIATIKKQHQAEEAGYYEGGFTGGRRYRRQAGVVHEGEFVANHQAVQNPAILPFLNFIDLAQRNNTVGTLSAEDVSRSMGAGGSTQVVAPIVNVQTDNSELKEATEGLVRNNDKLYRILEAGIYANVDTEKAQKSLKLLEQLKDNAR